MYVGTAHGWVLLFVVEREKNQTTLKTRLAGRINLGLGPKPVTVRTFRAKIVGVSPYAAFCCWFSGR